jgi:hypothetical protein
MCWLFGERKDEISHEFNVHGKTTPKYSLQRTKMCPLLSALRIETQLNA